MVNSMTGFGSMSAEREGISLAVTVQSVNHRHLEVAAHLPLEWLAYTQRVKQLVKERVQRGRVDLRLQVARSPMKGADFPWRQAEELIETARQVQARFQLEKAISVNDLLTWLERLSTEPAVPSPTAEAEEAFFAALSSALDQMVHMRRSEGALLERELRQRIQAVKGFLVEVGQSVPDIAADYRERVLRRLREWQVTDAVDESRLLAELALLAERSDIAEEITRLQSHGEQFCQALQAQEPIGKRLDFILQEMNREVNTLAAKAQNTAIRQRVVDIRCELEKLREQVQNIE